MKISTEIIAISLLLALFVLPVAGVTGDHLIVTDTQNHRIKMHYPADMTYLDQQGSHGTGNDNYIVPEGVYCDGHYTYIVDSHNDRIIKRDTTTNAYVAQVGSYGLGDTQFRYPTAITGDGSYLYVGDKYNVRIVKLWAEDLSYVSQYHSGWHIDGLYYHNRCLYAAGSHDRVEVIRTSDMTKQSEFGTLGTGNDHFSDPTGITGDGVHLYISDTNNHRIKKHTMAGVYVSQIGTQGSGNNQFNSPEGITLYNGELYIADRQNDRIKKHNAATLAYISTYGSTGAGNTQFDEPGYVYVSIDLSDTLDRVLVGDSDNNRLKAHYMSHLGFHSKTGTLGSGNMNFNNPCGVYSDGLYTYISDSSNNRIVKRSNYDYSYVAQTGSLGSGNANFNYPAGITGDGTYLYICDMVNCRIKKHLASDLSFVASFGSFGNGDNDFNYPYGICYANNNIYIADTVNDRIKKHRTSDLAYVSKFGFYGSGNNEFNFPKGITTDGTWLYIADTFNNRTKKHSLAGTYSSKIGSYGTGDDQYYNPYAISYDDGYLYVADTYNNRIKKLLAYNWDYIDDIGSSGSGDHQFNHPMAITAKTVSYPPHTCTACSFDQPSYARNDPLVFDYTVNYGDINTYWYFFCIKDSSGSFAECNVIDPDVDHINVYMAACACAGAGTGHIYAKHRVTNVWTDLNSDSTSITYLKPEATGTGMNKPIYDLWDGTEVWQYFLTIINPHGSCYDYTLNLTWHKDESGGIQDIVKVWHPLDLRYNYVYGTFTPPTDYGEYYANLTYIDEYGATIDIKNESFIVRSSSHECTSCSWNNPPYTRSSAYTFNYDLEYTNTTLYEYYFTITDSFDAQMQCTQLNPLLTVIHGNMQDCIKSGDVTGHIWALNLSTSVWEELNNTTSQITYTAPSAVNCAANETQYDVTATTDAYRFTYTISDAHSLCYVYILNITYHNDTSGGIHDTVVDSIVLDPANSYHDGVIPMNWFSGTYYMNLTYQNDFDVKVDLGNDDFTLLSDFHGDYQLVFHKDNYKLGESVQIAYATADPANTVIKLYYMPYGYIIPSKTKTWSNLGSDGTIYTSIDELGEYEVNMTYLTGTINDTAFGETNEAYNISIQAPVYYFLKDETPMVQFMGSASTGRNFTVAIFNPDNVMIEQQAFTYPTDYEEDSLIFKGIWYPSPTDGAGIFTFHLQIAGTNTPVATATCFMKIPDYTELDLLFNPDSINAGENLDLYFYIPPPATGAKQYSIEIRPPAMTTPIQSWVCNIDHTMIDGVGGYISYTVPIDRDTNTWTGVIADYDTQTDNMTVSASVIGRSIPSTESIGGVNAIFNLATATGFTGTSGLFIFAVLIILVIMYFLGKDLDIKSQLLLLVTCIVAFTVIGMIPVYVLIIGAIVVAAYITFNISGKVS